MFLAEGAMSISLSLVDSNSSIKRDIENAMLDQILNHLNSGSKDLQSRLKKIVPSWIESTPEIDSLRQTGVANSLASQLGLDGSRATLAVDEIKNAVASSVRVELNEAKKLKDISLSIFIQPEDFSNLLSITSASYVAEGGSTIAWLDWLLNLGTKTIIFGYSYEPDTSFGRSGGGFMADGGVWRIPPQFAGTKDNNFITRAFAGRERQLTQIVSSIFGGK